MVNLEFTQAVGKAVAILAANFGREVDEMLLEAYGIGLSELTSREIEQATGIAVRRCKFMPAASELIEYARTGGVSYESQALIAFEQLNVALDQNKPSLMPNCIRLRNLCDRCCPCKEWWFQEYSWHGNFSRLHN